ncbi:MAG: site-2 protease family protein [bacterium]|nr:site-2 protease family protein [bacterium]
MQTITLFSIIILIVSVIIHEVMHGYAAKWQGDHTAEMAGRLTLNPLPHLDLFGSILVPVILVFSGAPFVVGWAKPVPFNPFNLRNQKWGEAIVAVAGPLSNVVIAVFFVLLIRFSDILSFLPPSFIQISALVVIINLVLAVFNLMPFPPLDGSKIFFSILPGRYYHIRETMERYWFVFFLFFLFALSKFLFPVVVYIFRLLAGQSGLNALLF